MQVMPRQNYKAKMRNIFNSGIAIEIGKHYDSSRVSGKDERILIVKYMALGQRD